MVASVKATSPKAGVKTTTSGAASLPACRLQQGLLQQPGHCGGLGQDWPGPAGLALPTGATSGRGCLQKPVVCRSPPLAGDQGVGLASGPVQADVWQQHGR